MDPQCQNKNIGGAEEIWKELVLQVKELPREIFWQRTIEEKNVDRRAACLSEIPAGQHQASALMSLRALGQTVSAITVLLRGAAQLTTSEQKKLFCQQVLKHLNAIEGQFGEKLLQSFVQQKDLQGALSEILKKKAVNDSTLFDKLISIANEITISAPRFIEFLSEDAARSDAVRVAKTFANSANPGLLSRYAVDVLRDMGAPRNRILAIGELARRGGNIDLAAKELGVASKEIITHLEEVLIFIETRNNASTNKILKGLLSEGNQLIDIQKGMFARFKDMMNLQTRENFYKSFGADYQIVKKAVEEGEDFSTVAKGLGMDNRIRSVFDILKKAEEQIKILLAPSSGKAS